MIDLVLADDCPFYQEAQNAVDKLKSHPLLNSITSSLRLDISHQVTLSFLDEKQDFAPFSIDLNDETLLWRISHFGRNSEPLVKAVLGRLETPDVYDATAGLGRESMILAGHGCKVTMFERNPIVWLLLRGAVERLKNCTLPSGFTAGPPVLAPLGSILDHYQDGIVKAEAPMVVYYDPMFPKKQKSAEVKKNMQIFHMIVGEDTDTLEYANSLLRIAKHHLVVKRPVSSPPLELKVRRSSFVGAKQCRYDSYYCKNS